MIERIEISIAICTWNRAGMLRRTLDSLATMEHGPAGSWEVILVDNNSRDSTAEVCQSFVGQLPLRVVGEPEQGHSHSRNRAVAEARGEFMLWTDDDVLVSPNWLAGYRRAIERHPDAGFFGGPIEPEFAGRVPRWLAENRDTCDGVYARRQFGDREFQLGPDQLPYGANFATRRSVQQQFLFRPEFGRVADSVRGYDEIDVLTRMLSAGHIGYWVPDAGVWHLIPASRVNRRYIRDYFFGQGQTWVARGITRPNIEELQRQIRYHQRACRRARFSMSTRRWFGHWVQLGNLQGQLDQLLRSTTEGAEVPIPTRSNAAPQ